LGFVLTGEGFLGTLKEKWLFTGTISMKKVNYKTDLILTQGRIFTGNGARSGAVAIQGKRILAVGKDKEILSTCGPTAKRINLSGRLVLPGFIDAHTHFFSLALNLARLDLSQCQSEKETLLAVRKKAKKTKPGEWIWGRGWTMNLWPHTGGPSKESLDKAAPNNPVSLISGDGHSVWINSCALRLIPSKEIKKFSTSEVVYNSETHKPTGLFKERAASLVFRLVQEPPLELAKEALARAQKIAYKFGVTGIHNFERNYVRETFEALREEGHLNLRVFHAIAEDDLDEALEAGRKTYWGDESLRTGPLKLFADGSLGSRTAHMLWPYLNRPDYRGMEMASRKKLETLVKKAARAGISTAIHAIGDAAVRKALDVFEATRNIWAKKGLRQRIEHAQMIHPQDLPRFSRLNIIASVQPVHLFGDIGPTQECWGDRTDEAYPLKSLISSGACLAMGSDAPVKSLHPLKGIHAAVTRRDKRKGRAWHPEEKISLVRAISAYTQGAAFACGEEKTKGRLRPGYLADLVVLSQDILKKGARAIVDSEVILTVFGGRVVYRKGI